MRSVGVIYGVLGCLVLCEINAQYNGYGPYYNQNEYYKQYPQYSQAQANAYRGYSTPQGTNSNANNVQVIEVSIPDIPFPNSRHGSEGSLLTGVINQFLSKTGSAMPSTFSVHTYTDTKTPFVNTQNVYGNRSPSTPNTQYQSQFSSFNQPNYYQQQQQQQYAYAQQEYEQKLKQHQYQMEVQQYEQKLREYYAKYPTAVPPPTTTSLPHTGFSELVKPNEIKPIKHAPIDDDGKSLAELLLANQEADHKSKPAEQKGVPTGGKSLADLVKETTGQTEGGKSLADLLGEQPTTSTTEAPKKSLDDLIGNVFTEKPHKTTVAPEGGKSLFDLLAEIPKQEVAKPTEAPAGGKSLFDLLAEVPKPVTADNNSKSPDAASGIDESDIHGKKNSDIAGGDYGFDVRAEESKIVRVRRHILRETIEGITDRLSRNTNSNRHVRNHECSHHGGRNHQSQHNRGHDFDRNIDYNGFAEQHRHSGWRKTHNHDYGADHDSHFGGHHMHGFEHHTHTDDNDHRLQPNHKNDIEREKESKPDRKEKQPPLDEEKPVSQGDVLPTTEKSLSTDASKQNDIFETPRSEPTKDPTLDFDVRSNFEDIRRKRHNLKRVRRSPEEEEQVIFQDDEDESKPKVEAEEVESTTTAEETAIDSETANSNSTDGELDSRFGFLGGGGFHRQSPGRLPVGNFFGGVVNGVLGGISAGLQGYDPYQRGPPFPQYPVPYQGHGSFNNYPAPPQQPPVNIYINNVANAQSQATNTASGPFGYDSNQNAASNAQSETVQNQFGSFQNSGASGQASNLAQDGSSGQLSAANAMNQNYQNQFGFGSKNNAQSQAANFDSHGNLALTSSNSGTNHFAGPGGVVDETNSAAQSSLQGQFGTQNSGAQSNTYQGPNGSGSSASSQASSFNNGHGLQNSGSNAAANSGSIDGNSFGNAQSGAYTNDQWGW